MLLGNRISARAPKPDLTPEHWALGADALRQKLGGKNPASWVQDEDLWEKAKAAAFKTYDADDDAYWPVVTSIYKNMGGHIKKNTVTSSNTESSLEAIRWQSYQNNSDN